MKQEMPKTYNASDWEKELYAKWRESGFFNPDTLIEKGVITTEAKQFSVLMPPPNVTGILHLGHAMENSLMDTMARYKRMRGFRTLFLPGADHAAVATQARVEKNLVAAGIKHPRQELGREKLLAEIRTFAETSKQTIITQIESLGSSCDWGRFAYTFDEKRSFAVNTVFKKMFDDGLIYRGYRVVNWSVKGQSTCSDDELVHMERTTTLYTFRYTKDFPIAIATTRPETKLGDTAVAVHPNDERYQKYIGQTFAVDIGSKAPLTIKIIADENVSPEFGTGAVGVTPAHSRVDFEMYERDRTIGLISVIGLDGRMNDNAGTNYAGLTIEEARAKMVTWLQAQGLIEKTEEITQNVGTSDRFGDVVEALPLDQWFVDVNKEIPDRQKSLKDLMRDAVTIGHNGNKTQKITIQPERFQKIYLHWIDNLRDWCISRQIWWGHRIPVWYCVHCDQKVFDEFYYNDRSGEIGQGRGFGRNGDPEGRFIVNRDYVHVALENGMVLPPKAKPVLVSDHLENCPRCHNDTLVQDPDTLDTWFSSGMWSFSTLGGPDTTQDMRTFHPTSFMQMGHEILFFWMARMILMTTYYLDTIPFRDVYIHGMVLDKDGRKFSKSLGNGIDPLEVSATYGTDALRIALLSDITPGNDSRFSMDKVEVARNLVNKLWNIARYVLFVSETTIKEPAPKTHADHWILWRLSLVAQTVETALERYQFSQALHELRTFTWDEFADWYLEIHKVEKNDSVLHFVLDTLLRLWHPFAPFVTEALFQTSAERKDDELLLVERWPKNRVSGEGHPQRFQLVIELITAIRSVRKAYNIPSTKAIPIAVREGANERTIARDNSDIFRRLAHVSEIHIIDNASIIPKHSLPLSSGLLQAYIELEDIIDFEQERSRLTTEKTKLEHYRNNIVSRLSDERFTTNAPAHILEQTKSTLEETTSKITELDRYLTGLSS